MQVVTTRNFFIVLLITVFGTPAATAQSTEARLREMLADAQVKIRQLEADKAEMQARIDNLEQEMAGAESRAQALDRSLTQAQGQVQQVAQAANERTDLARRAVQRANELRQEAIKAQRAAQQAQRRNKQLTTVNQQLREQRNMQGRLVQIAADKNRELVRIGEDIIGDYQRLSLGESIAANEPFTQLYRVKLENKMQEFRDQVLDQQFFPEAVTHELQQEAQRHSATSVAANTATQGDR